MGAEGAMINFPDVPLAGQTFSSGALGWTWDGAKWVASGYGTAGVLSVNVLAPASAAVVTLSDYRPVYIDTLELVLLTIKLPPSPVSGSVVDITFANPVDTLVLQDSTGAVIPTAPTSAYGPGAALEFRYATSWVYWK
jgi:hypothetical protein